MEVMDDGALDPFDEKLNIVLLTDTPPFSNGAPPDEGECVNLPLGDDSRAFFASGGFDVKFLIPFSIGSRLRADSRDGSVT